MKIIVGAATCRPPFMAKFEIGNKDTNIMIDLKPAKSVQGRVELPISPDLLFMAALGACAAGRCIAVSGVGETDVVKDIIRALSGHANAELSESILRITPRPKGSDPALLLTLPESLLPYRVIYLFMGLGMGKTVVMKSTPLKQLEDFIARAKRIGIAVETVVVDDMTGLRATGFDSDTAVKSNPGEDDCAALLAFLFGKGGKLTFTITDYYLSIPLRQLAHAFGFTLSAKLAADDDPLAKRMRFMRGKQRDASAQKQTFIVTADFTGDINKAANDADFTGDTANDGDDVNCRGELCSPADGNALGITVPGDETLAAALAVLKILIPKGDLEIANAPIESWAMQAITFIKKMNGKVNIKDSGKTAFGLVGVITVNKSELTGRKTNCLPLYQYIGQLPCMTAAAAFAEGKSVFRELESLRLFDPDGLDQLEQSLRPLGVRHGEMPDGIVIEGAKDFDGFDILEPLPAHIAIAFCMAGLRCMGKTSIANDHIYARWPGFEKMISEICEFRSK